MADRPVLKTASACIPDCTEEINRRFLITGSRMYPGNEDKVRRWQSL